MSQTDSLKNALQGLTSRNMPELSAQMRDLQSKIRAATEMPSAVQQVISSLSDNRAVSGMISRSIREPGIDRMNDITEQLQRSAQAKAQRERETYDHTVKHTTIMEQSQRLQQQFAVIMTDQARLMEGLLLEAKSNTQYAKLAIYFAALSAMIGLIALLVK